MSHFYGSIPQSARKNTPTACGHTSTGLIVRAASWKGAIEVALFYDEKTDKDMFLITQRNHHGKGVERTLATGEVGQLPDIVFEETKGG